MDTLGMGIIPKECVPGVYDHEGAKRVFDAYVSELEESVASLFSISDENIMGGSEFKVDFAFSSSEGSPNGGTIEYVFGPRTQGVVVMEEREGEFRSENSPVNIYMGFLVIKQEDLDLETAGQLLNFLRRSSYVEVKPTSAGGLDDFIIYSGPDELKGIGGALYQRLGTEPLERAKFTAVSGAMAWEVLEPAA